METYITDLHSHPTFKPYNNQDDPEVNIWDPVLEKTEHYDALPKPIRPILDDTARDSQCNLNDLIHGKVRGVFFVIHPIERGWFDRRKNSPNPIRNAILKKVLKNEHLPHLAASLCGMPFTKAEAILKAIKDDDPIDYYNSETFEEYDFLRRSAATTGTQGATLTLVSNYNEYRAVLDGDSRSIAGIITIEGGHALLNIPKLSLTKTVYADLTDDEKRVVKNKYYLNIKKLKGTNTARGFEKKHTPLWITLVHMYNNFLAGHAKSYKEGTGIMPGMEDLLDQEVAMNDGITPLGKQVIERLLNRSAEERRILIDVKHMSLQARREYYQMLESKRNSGDNVPIIFSHGGVNGLSWDTFRGFDANADDHDAYVSKWSINLYDEDIKHIHASRGILGIAPHEGRVPGDYSRDMFKELQRARDWDDHRRDFYVELLRLEYIRLFLSNVFHCVSVIGKKEAWDMICIGSDYDGIMDPFDSYRTSRDFMRMLGDIKSFLDDGKSRIYGFGNQAEFQMPRSKMEALMFGYSSTDIIKKLAYTNTELFLKRYFNSTYLNGTASA